MKANYGLDTSALLSASKRVNKLMPTAEEASRGLMAGARLIRSSVPSLADVNRNLGIMYER